MNSWELFPQHISAEPSEKELRTRCYHHSCPFLSLSTTVTSQARPDPPCRTRALLQTDLQRDNSHGRGKAFACPKPDTAPRPHALHVAGLEDYKLDKSPSNVCN